MTAFLELRDVSKVFGGGLEYIDGANHFELMQSDPLGRIDPAGTDTPPTVFPGNEWLAACVQASRDALYNCLSAISTGCRTSDQCWEDFHKRVEACRNGTQGQFGQGQGVAGGDSYTAEVFDCIGRCIHHHSVGLAGAVGYGITPLGKPILKERVKGVRTTGLGGKGVSRYTTSLSIESVRLRAGARSGLRLAGRAFFVVWVVDTLYVVGWESYCTAVCVDNPHAY